MAYHFRSTYMSEMHNDFCILQEKVIAASPFNFDSSKADDDHILKKLQPRGVWYLTVLGSLATTQREYVALHAFRRLNMQVVSGIQFWSHYM